jgi:hypothetical protein
MQWTLPSATVLSENRDQASLNASTIERLVSKEQNPRKPVTCASRREPQVGFRLPNSG